MHTPASTAFEQLGDMGIKTSAYTTCAAIKDIKSSTTLLIIIVQSIVSVHVYANSKTSSHTPSTPAIPTNNPRHLQ
jgi:hypothetical protein